MEAKKYSTRQARPETNKKNKGNQKPTLTNDEGGDNRKTTRYTGIGAGGTAGEKNEEERRSRVDSPNQLGSKYITTAPLLIR